MVEALREAAARGARVASVCIGAFALAAAGLLDGLPATTHWAEAGRFRELFPRARLNPDVLYVDNGQFLTSAGLSAGSTCAFTWSAPTTVSRPPATSPAGWWWPCTARAVSCSTPTVLPPPTGVWAVNWRATWPLFCTVFGTILEPQFEHHDASGREPRQGGQMSRQKRPKSVQKLGHIPCKFTVMAGGAIIGGLVAASRPSRPHPRTLALACIGWGAVILLTGIAPNLWTACIALVFVGYGSITFNSTAKTTLQLASRPELRGRVMALWAMAWGGGSVIGAPLVGWAAEEFGSRWGLMIGGAPHDPSRPHHAALPPPSRPHPPAGPDPGLITAPTPCKRTPCPSPDSTPSRP